MKEYCDYHTLHPNERAMLNHELTMHIKELYKLIDKLEDRLDKYDEHSEGDKEIVGREW